MLSSILARIYLTPRGFLKSALTQTYKLSSSDLIDLESYRKFFLKAAVPSSQPSTEKVLLVASFMPLSYCLQMEGLMAFAMQERGYRVVVVTNSECIKMVSEYHKKTNGFDVYLLEDYLSIESFRKINGIKKILSAKSNFIKKIKNYKYRDANIGLNSLATLLTNNNVDLMNLDSRDLNKLKRNLVRSIFLMDATKKLIRYLSPSLVMSMEKGFVGTSELFYESISRRIPFIQWIGCHEPNSIMFKRYFQGNIREHPFSISKEKWEKIKEIPWSSSYSEKVMQQFKSGYIDGLWFKYKNLTTGQCQIERDTLKKRLSLNLNKKTAVIYSHILNDANLFYGRDLFDGGFKEWLVETVRVAMKNQNLNWVLKLHPANVYRNRNNTKSREYGELNALRKAFGKIPEFLKVVYPEDTTSPLSFFSITDYGITVRGTVGLELPCFGIPTLTAGTGRYSDKGFTIDSNSKEEYLSKILNLHKIPKLSSEQVKLGQRYAYFVFRIRPARYGDIFKDRYLVFEGLRRRDIKLDQITLTEITGHPQMKKIVDYLCSQEEDFLDNNHD